MPSNKEADALVVDAAHALGGLAEALGDTLVGNGVANQLAAAIVVNALAETLAQYVATCSVDDDALQKNIELFEKGIGRRVRACREQMQRSAMAEKQEKGAAHG